MIDTNTILLVYNIVMKYFFENIYFPALYEQGLLMLKQREKYPQCMQH